MGYLKQYIKGLDILTLKRFLHHVTGSDMIADLWIKLRYILTEERALTGYLLCALAPH